MSELRVNSIEKRNGNNVSMSDPLRLKSYTTTQRDALTSVVGDCIYNSTTNTPQYYDGSAWQDMKNQLISVSFVAIAGGGGSGGDIGSGGGAGGYRSSYASETSGGGGSAESALLIAADGSTTYSVTIGAGGTAGGGGSLGGSSDGGAGSNTI